MTRVLLAALVAAGGAAAAPVPKAPPPPNPKAGATFQLSAAKSVGNGQLELSSTVTVMRTVAVTENRAVGGQQVQVTFMKQVPEQVAMTTRVVLTGVTATTADGKELDEDALAKRLGDGGAVVQVPAGFDPEWRKVFSDDVVFLELKATAGVPRAGRVAPAVLRPALIPPPALPPPPPPPPPPVEKKEDKKDEKKEEKK